MESYKLSTFDFRLSINRLQLNCTLKYICDCSCIVTQPHRAEGTAKREQLVVKTSAAVTNEGFSHTRGPNNASFNNKN